MKGMHVGQDVRRAGWLHTTRALDRIVKTWRDAAPVNRWFDKHVGPSTLAPPSPTDLADWPGSEHTFATLGRVATLQRTLLGGGEPRVDAHARVERIELDDASWIDVARGWLLGADTLLDVADRHASTGSRAGGACTTACSTTRASRTGTARGDPLPHPALDDDRRALDAQLGVRLSGPACNYYRDGNDSVAWHADRELRELTDTRIAIVTLGARRPFLIRPKGGGKSRDLAPASGDLLVMGGACQMDWEHAVPKTESSGPRISCSWRWTNRRPGNPARAVSRRRASS